MAKAKLLKHPVSRIPPPSVPKWAPLVATTTPLDPSEPFSNWADPAVTQAALYNANPRLKLAPTIPAPVGVQHTFDSGTKTFDATALSWSSV
jgi:hypothetical protein